MGKSCPRLLRWVAMMSCDDELRWWVAMMSCDDELRWWVAMMSCDDELRWWVAMMSRSCGPQKTTEPVDCSQLISWAEDNKKMVDVFVVLSESDSFDKSSSVGERLRKYRKTMQIPHAKWVSRAHTPRQVSVTCPYPTPSECHVPIPHAKWVSRAHTPRQVSVTCPLPTAPVLVCAGWHDNVKYANRGWVLRIIFGKPMDNL